MIRDGIQPDDWVIVKGVQRAKTGAKVDPIKQALRTRNHLHLPHLSVRPRSRT